MIMTLARLLGVNTLVIKAGLVVLLVIGLGVAKCTYDRSVIDKHDAKVTTKTLKVDAAAKEAAAIERANDTASINQAEKDRNDEIRKAPDSKPSAARNRLNCDRLRRAGKDTSSIPACS